jgi:uncharacterized protein YjbI with pentapeptide repeats
MTLASSSNNNANPTSLTISQSNEPMDQHLSSKGLKSTQAKQNNHMVFILRRVWQWTGVKDKTLWEYLQLLIVPLLLTLVPIQISQYQKKVDDRQANIQKQINEERVQKEKEDALNKRQQDTLNSYIDAITDLMKTGLGKESEEGTRLVPIATSRTILTLRELNGSRNMIVVGFLKESKLIRQNPKYRKAQSATYQKEQAKYSHCLAEKRNSCEPPDPLPPLPPLSLKEANLSNVQFDKVDLNTLDLAGANLRDAKLTDAILIDTNLEKADLRGANLTGANLTGANLKDARLPAKELLQGVRYCDTKMPDGNKKNDDCSFIPQAGSQYKVVTGNNSGTSSGGWVITAYRDPVLQASETSVEVQHGTIVTLTGEFSVRDETTWVKIKDEGNIGGWVSTKYLVPVETAK